MIKAVVFDFDGTLVQSQRIKHDAWFEVFGSDQALLFALKTVLKTDLESSRFIIIRKVLETAGYTKNKTDLENQITYYSDRYNDSVLTAVKDCEELPGAEEILSGLAERISLYCSSNTPKVTLVEILKYRNWYRYFKAVYGYPSEKNKTADIILNRENITPEEILVVGDGNSDKNSAEYIGAHFLHIGKPADLQSIWGYIR